MTCLSCNVQNREGAAFCKSCGQKFQNAADGSTALPVGSSVGTRLSDRKFRPLLILAAVAFIVLVGLFFVALQPAPSLARSLNASSGSSALQPAITGLELNVPELGFKRRRDVDAMIGPPQGISTNGEDQYPWGTLEYKGGRVIALEYRFKQTPQTIDEAFAKVGLRQTSPPVQRESSNYQWAPPFSPPLVCCGFRFENVLIEHDLSDITIVFDKKIH